MSGVDRSEAEFLADYDLRAYPPVAVAVDLALLTVRDARLCVLLVRRAGHPERGHWALPGGFNRKVMATDGFVFAADPPAPSRRVSGPPPGNRRVLYRRGPASVVEPPLARPAKDEVAL